MHKEEHMSFPCIQQKINGILSETDDGRKTVLSRKSKRLRVSSFVVVKPE